MVLCYSCAPKEQVVTAPIEKPAVVDVKPPEAKPVWVKPVDTRPVVPDVVGKTAPDATAAIDDVDNLTGGTITYEFSDTLPSGLVIGQRPPAGTSVPIGASVDLVVSRGPPVAVKQPPKEPPVVEKPVGLSTVVGKISDYVFTRGELEKRVLREVRANPDEYVKEKGSVDTKAVLEKMIAEKAMIIDARQQNFLEVKDTKAKLKQFKDGRLATLLLRTELQEKAKVTDAEIDEKIASNPNLKRAQVKARLEKQKEMRLTNQFYEQLYEKLHVQKLKGNFARAARIHQRLLFAPREGQRIRYIKKKHVEEDLTPEEKNLVLATYENGKLTLEDWFYALCRPAPTKRPTDLHTAAGVERFLDRILRLPVFVTEAKLRGLDKDQGYVKQVRQQEDATLFRKAIVAKYEQVKKPTEEEITAYFNENKEKFRTPDRLKIDQIWCQDFKTAQKVKEQLRSGKDFESVKQEYSFAKKDKPVSISPSREGMLSKDLLNAEPNEIVGPMKGFYLDRGKRPLEWHVKWRVVKVLQKKPGAARESAKGMEREVSRVMRHEQREAVLAKYRKELLQKYPYEIYSEKIKDINPLNIP